MKKLNALRLICSIILYASLTSCAISPPDVFVFQSLEQHVGIDEATGHTILKPSPACMTNIQEFECGHGTSIVSGKEIFVGEKEGRYFEGKPWSQIKRESILVPAKESYAPLVEYIINSCAKLKCDKDVTRFKVKIDTVNPLAKERPF